MLEKINIKTNQEVNDQFLVNFVSFSSGCVSTVAAFYVHEANKKKLASAMASQILLTEGKLQWGMCAVCTKHTITLFSLQTIQVTHFYRTTKNKTV